MAAHALQTHPAAAPEPGAPLPLHRETALKKAPGGTCQKLETLVVLLQITAYLSLPWWQLPKLLFYKAPPGLISVRDFGQVT